MKLFECENCGQLLYFENTECERCGHRLGFLPGRLDLCALEDEGGGTWAPLSAPDERHRFCANAQHDACNWMVPADGGQDYCPACRLNRTIPDLSDPNNLLLWQRLEAAKHNLVYGLMRLGLPVISKYDDRERGLAFDFLADPDQDDTAGPSVVTGHDQGLITINIEEADPVEREKNRQNLSEPYRTLLGHFRHEVGHYYWDRLVRDGGPLETCRETFGDETQDYGDALKRHYDNGPPDDWQDRFISHYASSHPWEDFAETWAHYLHIVDTLDTAAAFGLSLTATAGRNPPLQVAISIDPYAMPLFDAMMESWTPLTAAVNSLNHSMGQPDLYPFVMTPAVMGKLRFVHGLIHGQLSR